MNYHNITKTDLKNGDGLRVVLWVAGCNHMCKECQNPETWDACGGLHFDDSAKQEIFAELDKDYISGITFSGGDPFFPSNREVVGELMQEIHKKYPNKTIWCYTGYTFEQIQDLVKEKQLSDNMKTACLRVAKIRLQNGELEKNEKIINSIEEQYGKEAAIREKKIEKNLLHWECVEKMQEDKEMQEKLHKPMEYLKAKDLRAFKIVIANVPDELKTDNIRIKRIIEKRSKAYGEDLKKYNDMCCIELEKDFANYLLNSPELLKQMNIEIPNDGYKWKNKENGYIADHIKFHYIDHPEYTFELQLRSIYREELSRANGPAAHNKRSGKERIFPSVENKEEFLKELKERIPSYTILEDKPNGYNIRRCNLMENMLEYYLGYIKLNSKEHQKAMEYIREDMEKEK